MFTLCYISYISYVSYVILSIAALNLLESKNHENIVIPLKVRNHTKRRIKSKLDTRSLNIIPLRDFSGDYYQVEYYGSLEIGTPSKSFQVLFDTGVTDMWVTGFECLENHQGRQYYDPRISSSANALPGRFEFQYFDDIDISGSLISDNVTIGGFTVTEQIFGIANVIKGPATTSSAIGVMGLNYFESSEFGVETFLENLIKNGALSEKSFGFFFARTSESESESQLTLNGYDKDKAGTPNFNPLIDQTNWNISIDSVSINERVFIKPPFAMINTAASGIYVSKSYASTFYKPIGRIRKYHDGTYSFPCKSTPSVVFKFSGINYPILKSDLVIHEYKSRIPFESKRCIGSVIAIDVVENYGWILGYSFLKNVYTVFDIANRQIGFTSLVSSNSEKLS